MSNTNNKQDEKLIFINNLMKKIQNLKNVIKGKKMLLARFESKNFSLAKKAHKVNTLKNLISQDVRNKTKNNLRTVFISNDMTFEQ